MSRLTNVLGSLETTRYNGLFDHFHAVRGPCTPEQQAKFDTVIVKVLQLLREPPGMPRPPDKPPK